MNQWASKQKGFTIVELLIVVVVIAILAAVTIVSYNGIRERTVVSGLQTMVSQGNKKVMEYSILNGSQYPSTLAEIGLSNSPGKQYQLTSDNTANPRTYCLTASDGLLSYYTSSTNNSVTLGVCPGQNLAFWIPERAETLPLSVASANYTETREAGRPSLQFGPNNSNRSLRISPLQGVPGERVIVSLWLKTDTNWNGLSNNSKVRYGNGTTGAILKACEYSGVKTTWTYIECDYTLTTSIPSVTISIGNDGSTGNIYVDQLSVSKQ